jgi:hypothetical protein
MDFYSILAKYVGNNRLIFYQSKLIHFTRSNNINKYINNQLIQTQNGGSTYSTIIDDIEFKFDYYINKSDDNKIMYISDINDKLGLKYCAMLTYSNKDVLNIGLIETPVRCLNIMIIDKKESKEIISTKLKYGTIMMRVIIKFAIDNGFKKIHLDDISRFNCIDRKKELSYSLLHVHILTNGQPWYYNFNFKFINNNDHLKVKKNKSIIQSKLTRDLPFDKLLLMIYTKISNSDYSELITTEIIYSILKLYIKLKDQKLGDFIKKFTKLYCQIMSFIHMDIYGYFNLESFDTNSMELILSN